MELIECTEQHKSIWNEYVQRSPQATVAHLFGWSAVMTKGLGHKTRFIMAMDNSLAVGVMPLCLIKTWWGSRYLISLPWIDYGGICADNREIEKALLQKASQIAQQEKVDFIEFRTAEFQDIGLVPFTGRVTFVVPLEPDPEIVFKRLDPKLRVKLRKVQKSQVYTELGGKEFLPDFYKVFSWKMRDLGTPVWGYNFFATILDEFGQAARVILVKRNGELLAAGIVLLFKDRLYVPSAGSYTWALQYCPNHALNWELIRKGCLEGYKYFDFGRSTVNSATYTFKKAWVDGPTQLKWQYYLNMAKEIPTIRPDNPKYRLAISVWRKLPLSITNFLGPKVIKNFP